MTSLELTHLFTKGWFFDVADVGHEAVLRVLYFRLALLLAGSILRVVAGLLEHASNEKGGNCREIVHEFREP